MSITQKRIYDKLFSNNSKVEKKHNFKRNHKVSLNTVDELNTSIDDLTSSTDHLIYKSDLMQSIKVITEANEFLKTALSSDLLDIDNNLSDLVTGIRELGVEIPQQVQEMQSKLDSLYEEKQSLQSALDSINL